MEGCSDAGVGEESVEDVEQGVAVGIAELDVTDVYDILAELTVLASRLPQALVQLDAIIDWLVEADRVVIVDGDNVGDPVAAAATMGHWTEAARDAIMHATIALDHAQRTLTWAARPNPTKPLGK